MLKKIVAIVSSLAVIFSYTRIGNITVYAESITRNTTECTTGDALLTEAVDYAEKHYLEMVKIIEDMQSDFGITISEISNISLGEPYYIYDVGEEEQNAEFYFPVYDNNKIILLLNVIGTEKGWSVSIDCQEANILNEMCYGSDNCVFYNIDESIYVENNDRTVLLYESQGNGEPDAEEEKFIKMSLAEKEKLAENAMDDIKPVDIGDESLKTGATPGLVSTVNGKYLNISGFYTGQGNYNLCWAACIATTYRYRTQTTSLTAIQVANLMGENYSSSSYAGASASTILQAFRKYGLYYKSCDKILSWSTIQKNINNYYPVTLVGSRDGGNNHAVLITAYVQYNGVGTTYVKIWDPYEETVQLSEYSSRVSFKSNGIIYHYNKTYSFYK